MANLINRGELTRSLFIPIEQYSRTMGTAKLRIAESLQLSQIVRRVVQRTLRRYRRRKGGNDRRGKAARCQGFTQGASTFPIASIEKGRRGGFA